MNFPYSKDFTPPVPVVDIMMTIEMWARGKWGGRRRVNLFLVDVHIGESVLPHVQVVGDEVGDEIILGRDVLNKLKLLLDGPAAVAHVYI